MTLITWPTDKNFKDKYWKMETRITSLGFGDGELPIPIGLDLANLKGLFQNGMGHFRIIKQPNSSKWLYKVECQTPDTFCVYATEDGYNWEMTDNEPNHKVIICPKFQENAQPIRSLV